MTEILDNILMWATSIFYGILASIYIIKRLVIQGPSKVFYWKQWDRPHILDDPKFGKHGFLTLKDVRIHYVASGPEDKPLMLFVHGFPEFWYSWRFQIIEFQKDYRVVAIDQRGYSESGKPSGIGNYTAVKLMSDLEQVIQALGYKKCILVAHDWGGLIAWAFSRHFPNMVDKLIIMNAPPFSIFSNFLKTSKDQAKKSWYVFLFQLPFLPELNFKIENYSRFDALLPSKYKTQGSSDENSTKDENIVPYKYTFSQPGALTPPLNYYRNLMRNTEDRAVYEHDMEYAMPILVVWGCQDKAINIGNCDAIEREISTVTVKRIPDASHFVQMDAPDEVNKAMREWLNEH